MRKEKNTEKTALELVSAEPLEAEYAPVVRVALAVCYMGIMAGVVAMFAAVLALVSGRQAADRLAMSVAAAVIFALAAGAVSVIDAKKRKRFEQQRDKKRESAKKYSGNIVSCEKHSRKFRYGSEDFTEVTWRFNVEYKNENGDTETVKTGRYLNDISNIIESRDVTVLKTEDGELIFEDIRLSENGITLDIEETEEDQR